ncbi:MAG: N-6 DNA methylase [Polyangiales bacterium]
MQDTIDQLVGRLVDRDGAAATPPRTEATVQADVRQLLLTAPFDLDEAKVVTLEAQVGNRRRIDVEVGATVIEVKKDLRVGNVLADAITQLEGYVADRERERGGRYVGVLTDGAEWRCYHLATGRLVEVSSLLLSASRPDAKALLSWLDGVLATATGLKPTPEAIEEKLGAASSAHRLDLATLSALYAAHHDAPEVRTKRALWARLLATALGTQFSDDDALFIEHTLLVNSAEIIAHAVLGLPVATVAPASLLSGAKFDESGIYGVVEADFFDWVVAVPGGDGFVRALARRLARFEWAEVDRDVLKVLYESVILAEKRKQLGEYYTPDWLAQQVVEAVVTEPLTQRALDPSCGSGTFLFHAVRRYLRAAEEAGVALPDMLRGVTRHVLGMDLHPVAVTFARVTYVLAIGRARLTSPQRGPLHVPVYLGDSMLWRRDPKDLLSATGDLKVAIDDQVRPGAAHALVPTQLNLGGAGFEQAFNFPGPLLKDAGRFDQIVAELAKRASSRTPRSPVPSLRGVFQRLAVPEDQQPALTTTFQTLCRLHDEGRDHIWGYYIRNMARPEWLARAENHVDALIGNPPWLSYRFMPASMQRRFRELSEARRLWSGGKVATQQDLSTLFIARVVQLYLKDEGRFGFVTPDAVPRRPRSPTPRRSGRASSRGEAPRGRRWRHRCTAASATS